MSYSESPRRASYASVRSYLLAFAALVSISSIGAASAPLEDAPLRAVQFVDEREGWAVGDQGVVLHSIDGGKTWERQPTGSDASLRGLYFITPYTGWIVGRTELAQGVGSAGTVLHTSDGGLTWKERSSGRLPGLNSIRFRDEKNGRIEGDGIALVTTDGGATWNSTGSSPSSPETASGPKNVPVHATFFLNPQIGWSVGEMGNIFRTDDGGKNWSLLKSGGQKAAVLFLHTRAASTPLGAVAMLAKDGYHTAAVCFDGEANRLAQAMRSVGGTSGTVGERLQLADLVLAIRMWRPEVIVTDKLSPDASPRDQKLLLLINEAFEKAADESAFPEQLRERGLTPHAAKKLYALSDDAKTAGATMDLTAFVPELDDAPKDRCESASRLLGAENPDRLHFRLIAHRLPSVEPQASLMQGIVLAPAGPSRRAAAAASDPLRAAMSADREKWSKTRRELETLLAHPETADGWTPALTQAFGKIRTLPNDLAAKTAVSLGFSLAKAGQWTAARELFALAADQYAAYPESVEAIRWLIRYHGSAEALRRIELGHFPMLQRSVFLSTESEIVQASAADSPLATAKYRFATTEVQRQWSQYALDLEPKLAAFGDVYVREATTQLALNAARRRLGLFADALKVAKVTAPDEAAILDGQAKAPVCRRVETTPFLDGKLEESCWKAAASLSYDGAKDCPTKVLFTRDDRFLYIAVVCGHPKGTPPAKAESRSRDENLSRHDRVEIQLDLDRDRETYFRLCIDQRGCLAEDCTGDAGWNPRWFVAANPGAESWVAECAVPLSELTGEVVNEKNCWMIHLKRIVPNVGETSHREALHFTK